MKRLVPVVVTVFVLGTMPGCVETLLIAAGGTYSFGGKSQEARERAERKRLKRKRLERIRLEDPEGFARIQTVQWFGGVLACSGLVVWVVGSQGTEAGAVGVEDYFPGLALVCVGAIVHECAGKSYKEGSQKAQFLIAPNGAALAYRF